MEKITAAKIGMTRIFNQQGKNIAVTLLAVGKENLSRFSIGQKVIISGLSKGKGFAGVIKRHGFSRGPETHGSDHHRAPGSIGSAFPQRVFPGKKLPGRMGRGRVTLKNRPIVAINEKELLISLKGALPGPNKSRVIIEL